MYPTPFQHVRGLGIWREVGELTHEPARFFQRFHTVVATGGKVGLQLRAFRGVKRANRVGFDQLPEMVPVRIIAKEIFSFVGSRGDVKLRARLEYSQSSRHDLVF